MSGEYFCVEEVGPNSYFEEYEKRKSNQSSPRNHSGCAGKGENDTKSNTSKKSQDIRLYEIEEQLQMAENRCTSLKNQLDSMKKFCQNGNSEHNKLGFNHSQVLFDKQSVPIEKTFTRKISRRLPNVVTSINKSRFPLSVKKSQMQVKLNDVPMKSSSSSSATQNRSRMSVVHNAIRHNFEMPLVRQTPNNIMTDYSNGPMKTITNIVTGITDNISQQTGQTAIFSKEKMKRQRNFSEIDAIYEIPGQFSPRVEKRMMEQRRNLEEMVQNKTQSQCSVKSKKRSWLSNNSLKSKALKNKIHISSGSLSIAKPKKSSPKQLENANLPTVKTAGILDDDLQSTSLARKRKKTLKRLRASSKRYDQRKVLDGLEPESELRTNDNLIELYYNCDVKISDSDESQKISKTQLRQKGGGDRLLKTRVARQSVESNNRVGSSKRIRQNTPTRILTPIAEGTFRDLEEDMIQEEYIDSFIKNYKNYAQPTIASKLKKVCKRYLQAFNVRQIPFCVAKSTSPSHNIGINIQQVMSIIQNRRAITGISATLAHNIGLAAGKFQNNPLSTLVSTLSSKMTYRRSHCPLMKTRLDYAQLQEIAKTIENDPYDIRPNFAGDGGSESVMEKPLVTESNESQGVNTIVEEKRETATWIMEAPLEENCTCGPPKGVPFRQVLSKFHMSTDCFNQKPSNVVKVHVPRARTCKSACVATNVRKNRTRSWINSTSASKPEPASKKSSEDLQGKEKKLKTVLTNLYEEFDNLNKKYESLSQEANLSGEGMTEDIARELEDLEKTLYKKETEINMVMSLYTEVLALKDQVTKLRDNSQSAVTNNNQSKSNSNEKEPAAAAHLTQLLRQIQNYRSQCNTVPRDSAN